MKRILMAVSALAAMQSAAFAADWDRVAPFGWTGLYAGLSGGYAFSGEDKVEAAPNHPGSIAKLDLRGTFGGVDVGYNWQVGRFVGGLEGDIQYSDITDRSIQAGRATDDNDWFGTLRARAGFAFENTLVYATGGLAYGEFNYHVMTPTPTRFSKNYEALGFVVGGGVEYAFDQHWSMKAEYLYFDYEDKTFGPAGERTTATPGYQTARVGFNYKF